MEIANHLDIEIVNCDSMQLHREMNIGTAKPRARWRRRVPHHLFDLISPDEYYSAGQYMTDGRRLCHQIRERGRVPVVVGGTGLYLRALVEGIFEGPGRSDRLRQRLCEIERRKGLPFLRRLLCRVDPVAANQIQSGDQIRMIRALEVYFLAGKPITHLQRNQEPLSGFRVLKVGLTMARQELYDRIDRRVESMFEKGLVDEVKQLLKTDYLPNCKGFEALGYRHVVAYLQGRLDHRTAIEYTQQDTRRYAKRQLTWFRRDKEIHWIHGSGEQPETLEQFLKICTQAGGPLPSTRQEPETGGRE